MQGTPWLAFFTVTTLACCRGSAADQAANAFVDAYYLEYDFTRAKALAEGAALARLEREESLALAVRAQVAVADSRTRAYYAAPERKELSSEQVHYRYLLQIRHGSSSIDQPAELFLVRRGGAWKVTRFREGGPGVGDGEAGDGVRTGTVSGSATTSAP